MSETRERILAAAVRRIAREGMDDVRIARIAMDAGVSSALVHYHFDSRDALLAEAIEHSYERAGAIRIGDGEPEPATAPDRLRQMIDQCLPASGELRDDWLLWVELWLRASRDETLRPIAARLYARMHEWFSDAIAQGIADGELRDVDVAEVADRILALIDGFGVRALLADPRVDVERARRAIWTAVEGDLVSH